jgi:hypothetical protein
MRPLHSLCVTRQRSPRRCHRGNPPLARLGGRLRLHLLSPFLNLLINQLAFQPADRMRSRYRFRPPNRPVHHLSIPLPILLHNPPSSQLVSHLHSPCICHPACRVCSPMQILLGFLQMYLHRNLVQYPMPYQLQSRATNQLLHLLHSQRYGRAASPRRLH